MDSRISICVLLLVNRMASPYNRRFLDSGTMEEVDVILPFPQTPSGNISIFRNGTSVEDGSASVSLVDTDYGAGLNVTFSLRCEVVVKYEVPYTKTEIEDDERYGGFTLAHEDHKDDYLAFLRDSRDNRKDVTLFMKGYRIEFWNEPAFSSWGPTWVCTLEPGWHEYPCSRTNGRGAILQSIRTFRIGFRSGIEGTHRIGVLISPFHDGT